MLCVFAAEALRSQQFTMEKKQDVGAGARITTNLYVFGFRFLNRKKYHCKVEIKAN